MTDDVKPAHQLAANRRFLMAEDVDLIQTVVPREGEPIVVDLGSGSGTTALAVLDENPNAIIYTADIDVANRDWAEANVVAHYPDASVEYFVGSAVEAAEDWVGLPIDLLLHDAGHQYDDVYGDLRAWHELLPDGCPVWVHDFASPPPDWGSVDESGEVQRALEDLMRQGFFIEDETRGLGWLGRAVKL